MPDDVGAGKFGSLANLNPRANDLSGAGSGNTVHVDCRHSSQRFDRAFNFDWIHFDAANVDHAAQSAGEVEAAGRINVSKVAGTKEPVRQDLAIEFGFAEIAGHSGGRTSQDFARLPCSHILAGGIHASDLDVGQRNTHELAAQGAGRLARGNRHGDSRCLGRAVPLDNRGTEVFLPSTGDAGLHARAAGYAQTHGLEKIGISDTLGQLSVYEGRTDDDVDLFARGQFGVFFRQESL